MPYQCLAMLGKKESHPLPFPCDACVEVPWSHVNKMDWTIYKIGCLSKADPKWQEAPKSVRFWIEAEHGEKVRQIAETMTFPDQEMPDGWWEAWSIDN